MKTVAFADIWQRDCLLLPRLALNIKHTCVQIIQLVAEDQWVILTVADSLLRGNVGGGAGERILRREYAAGLSALCICVWMPSRPSNLIRRVRRALSQHTPSENELTAELRRLDMLDMRSSEVEAYEALNGLLLTPFHLLP